MTNSNEELTWRDCVIIAIFLAIFLLIFGIITFFSLRSYEHHRLSHIYTNLHKAPICSVTKTNPDGSPSDFFCTRISVTASADIWNEVKDYEPTKSDIQATTVQYDKNHITWAKDVIQEDY